MPRPFCFLVYFSSKVLLLHGADFRQRFSYFHLPVAGITGVHHHDQPCLTPLITSPFWKIFISWFEGTVQADPSSSTQPLAIAMCQVQAGKTLLYPHSLPSCSLPWSPC
jgi:hypothetical protein